MTAIRGSTVAVVGGSIAGCAAAIALSRSGCNVTVFERTRGELQNRGGGILIPVPLRDELIAGGYLPANYPSCPLDWRVWLVQDGAEDIGRTVWRQATAATSNNWGALWRSLRSRVPDGVYREGSAVERVSPSDAGIEVELSDGAGGSFDLLVGADGYRSLVRELVHPGSAPVYAGYMAWRGVYPESRVLDHGRLEEAYESKSWFTVCLDGGHGAIYLIPGFDGSLATNERQLNWLIYCDTPAGVHFDEPESVPPGAVGGDLGQALDDLLEVFPPYFASLLRLTEPEEISIQPIYDQQLPTYVRGPVALIGDASTITRPHTGSGATKALQDALALEQACAQHGTWSDALASYNEERSAAGNGLVALGRRIGRAQVEETPDWGSMSSDDFDEWTRRTLSGEHLYLYRDL